MNFKEVAEFLRQKIEQYSSILPPEDLGKINNFLVHDEYEMAFEGLVLELLRLRAEPDEAERAEWLRHAESLGLKDDPTFDSDFWQKMQQWAGKS